MSTPHCNGYAAVRPTSPRRQPNGSLRCCCPVPSTFRLWLIRSATSRTHLPRLVRGPVASADGSIWAALWAVSAADEQTVLVQTSYGLVPIGWVQSALRVLDDAPNQRGGHGPQTCLDDVQRCRSARPMIPARQDYAAPAGEPPGPVTFRICRAEWVFVSRPQPADVTRPRSLASSR